MKKLIASPLLAAFMSSTLIADTFQVWTARTPRPVWTSFEVAAVPGGYLIDVVFSGTGYYSIWSRDLITGQFTQWAAWGQLTGRPNDELLIYVPESEATEFGPVMFTQPEWNMFPHPSAK